MMENNQMGNNHMDRPAKLDGSHKKYSLLLPENVLESMRIIARLQRRTTATLFREVVEEFVTKHALFRGEQQ